MIEINCFIFIFQRTMEAGPVPISYTRSAAATNLPQSYMSVLSNVKKQIGFITLICQQFNSESTDFRSDLTLSMAMSRSFLNLFKMLNNFWDSPEGIPFRDKLRPKIIHFTVQLVDYLLNANQKNSHYAAHFV